MGRPKTYDRDEVLQRATRLFWQKGYEGTRLQELVEVTGINRFSLYKEFGSKRGLFEAALGAYVEDLRALADHLAQAPLGVGNIRRYFDAQIERGFRHGCLILNGIQDKHVLPAPTFEAVQGFVARIEASFLTNLRASKERGELAAGIDLVARAKFLTAFHIGVMSYGILSPGTSDRLRMLSVLDDVLR